MPTLRSNFNCCTAPGKNLSVGSLVTSIKDSPPGESILKKLGPQRIMVKSSEVSWPPLSAESAINPIASGREGLLGPDPQFIASRYDTYKLRPLKLSIDDYAKDGEPGVV